MDILTYHISGEYLQYHQNQSQELYGHSDSLVFILKIGAGENTEKMSRATPCF